MPISHPYRIDATGRTASPADEAAHVRELIELVLFTNPGERVMRPTFGSGVHQLVFAPAYDELSSVAEHMVRAALQQWLAEWLEVQGVAVRGDDSTLTITISYVLRRTGERSVATFQRST
jgi:phage baseplate assembly protein W